MTELLNKLTTIVEKREVVFILENEIKECERLIDRDRNHVHRILTAIYNNRINMRDENQATSITEELLERTSHMHHLMGIIKAHQNNIDNVTPYIY